MIGAAMKKHATLYVLICLLAAVVPGARAAAASFTMGRMQTVGSDGSLDATLSPSLLTAQRTDNAIGVLLLYAPFASHGYAYDHYRDSSFLRNLTLDAAYSAGSVLLSYSRKTPAGVVGLALDADDTYGGESRRYKRAYAGIWMGTISYTEIKGKAMAMSPRAVFSFGGTVKGEHSVGVQCAAGYSLSRDDTNYSVAMNFQPSQKHHASKRTEEARAELSFGYSYRNADSQAGLMIRSGRFAWQKTKIYYNHADFYPQTYLPFTFQILYAGSVSEPYAFKYDRGFSIIAGGYHRPARFIALALEGELQVPIAYSVKDLRFDETTFYFGVLHNLGIRRSGVICIRAGFEIMPAGPVVISLGGSARIARERKKGAYLSESVKTEEYGGTFGLDIRAVDNLLIMAGSRLTYTRERKKSSTSYNFFGSGSFDGLATLLHADCFIGTSVGF